MINLILRNYPVDRYSCQPVSCACISESYSGYDELRQSADIAVLIAESPNDCGSSFINSIASGFALMKLFSFHWVSDRKSCSVFIDNFNGLVQYLQPSSEPTKGGEPYGVSIDEHD
jgi:hypothetical protein